MELEIYVDPYRDSEEYGLFCELMRRLGWSHYPTNVTGEDIDNGNDSDEARAETIECPPEDAPLLGWLNDCGTFDDL